MDKWWDSLSRTTKIIIIGLILFLTASTFPPWEYTISGRGIHSAKPAGYHFIFSSPAPEYSNSHYGVKINFSQLFMEWVVIIVSVAAGVFVTLKKEQEKEKNDLADKIADAVVAKFLEDTNSERATDKEK